MKLYEVEFERTYTNYGYIEVEAENEDGARRAALDLLKRGLVIWEDVDSDDAEPDGVINHVEEIADLDEDGVE